MKCQVCDTRMIEERLEEVCGCLGDGNMVVMPAHCPNCGWVLGEPLTSDDSDWAVLDPYDYEKEDS